MRFFESILCHFKAYFKLILHHFTSLLEFVRKKLYLMPTYLKILYIFKKIFKNQNDVQKTENNYKVEWKITEFNNTRTFLN